MTFLIGITTYNRFRFLRKTIESWNRTRSREVLWHLIVADDGSTDETRDYLARLNFEGVTKKILIHSRKGVHVQTNSILKEASSIKYEVGFKCDDDILFKRKGWDIGYQQAIRKTGKDHLVFIDPSWYSDRDIKINQGRVLQSYLLDQDHIQGAFWTFTPRVIKKIGFFDISNFGWGGYGHVDYTFRCCRAGFNTFSLLKDMKKSQEFIELIKKDYTSAVSNKERFSHNTPEKLEHKRKILKQDRIYVPFQ